MTADRSCRKANGLVQVPRRSDVGIVGIESHSGVLFVAACVNTRQLRLVSVHRHLEPCGVTQTFSDKSIDFRHPRPKRGQELRHC